jgi:bacterioferritin-associated ferredoxin
MIVCLCRGVPEAAVGAVIDAGASSLDDISAACTAGADCGGCHESLLDMLAGRARAGRCGLLAPALAG